MNENIKTGIYAGIALLVLAVAVMTWPRTEVIKESDIVGQNLFPEFKEPLEARKLRIVSPDAESGRFNEFSIAQRNGVWVIPSHGNYPVDSDKRLQDAALALFDLEVIDIASESPEDHGTYGVVEPDPSGAAPADEDMGTRVVLRDEDDKQLAELIIGHADSKNSENRFVRIPGRDAVYVVNLSVEPFATKFADWINTDLLDVESSQLSEFIVKDYSLSFDDTSVSLLQRFMLHAFNNVPTPSSPGTPPPPARWDVVEFEEAGSTGALEASELLLGEELNTQAISSMLRVADELKIADVVRKPAAMAEQMRQNPEYFSTTEFGNELVRYGYLPVRRGDRMYFYSYNGEVILRTNDGIEYALSFGRPLTGDEGSTASDLRRYMMVIARVNRDAFPDPTLFPEPTPPQPAAAVEPAADEAAGDSAAPGDTDGEEGSEEPPVPPAPLVATEGEPSETAPEGVSQEDWDTYRARREIIRRQNEDILDAYHKDIERAENRVRELNQRFADWFYVISDSEYEKIHLSRTELLTSGEGGVGVGRFEELIEEGVDGPPPPSSGPPQGLPPGHGFGG